MEDIKLSYNLHHVNGLFFELLDDGGYNHTYHIYIQDLDNNDILYQSEIKPNTWVRLNRKYLSNLLITVTLKGRLMLEINLLDYLVGKRIFISFDSKSLGDTLAWIGVCEEFRKHYDCELLVSTFMNDLFESTYPDIQFLGRGVVAENLAAMFELGWFYDKEREPRHPATIPLQQAAKNILYMSHNKEEILPDLTITGVRPIQDKYVCISTVSTAQLKHWYYWQDLIDMLKAEGYKVVELSKEPTNFDGLEEVADKSLKSIKDYLYHCEFYIGLSSGISWLAWAMRTQVYMIANFSLPEHEFQHKCVRITNHHVCHGCWNNPMYRFNRGDWNWCPVHEDTPRQFECHKTITASWVMKEIKKAGY